jgi:hypothetical protein
MVAACMQGMAISGITMCRELMVMSWSVVRGCLCMLRRARPCVRKLVGLWELASPVEIHAAGQAGPNIRIRFRFR